MNSMFVSLVIFSLLINFISATIKVNRCNDDCLTKTYCLSPDRSNVCSENNLITAKWFVQKNDHGDDDRLGLTLTGQSIKQ